MKIVYRPEVYPAIRAAYVIGEKPTKSQTKATKIRDWMYCVYWIPQWNEASIPPGEGEAYVMIPCHSLLEAIALYERWRKSKRKAK